MAYVDSCLFNINKQMVKNFNLSVTDYMLLVNDIHIAKEKINDFRDNWKEVVDVAENRGVKYILIGGDLFEARHSQTLQVLIEIQNAFEMATHKGIQIIVANGNHDKVNQEDNEGYCHLYKYMVGVHVIDTFAKIITPNANIFMLAYFPETGTLSEKIADIMDTPEFSNGNPNILYAHAGVVGALGQEAPSEISAKTFAKFDKVYMGHYHGRKKHGKNIYYIGSSRQFNYGEDEEKGYNLCDSFGDLEFIKNEVNTRFATIKIDYDEIDSVPDMVAKIKDNAPVKYLVRCVVDEPSDIKGVVDKQQLMDFGVDSIKINTIVKTQTGDDNSSLYKKFDKAGIIESYKEFCDKNDKDAELGIKYLS